MTHPSSASDTREKLFLTFRLRGRLCALGIGDVSEIIEFAEPTGMPAGPEYLSGILNLRGRGLLVLDPASHFFGGRSVPSRTTCIVILQESGSADEPLCGVLVDSVHDVISIPSGQMESAADISAEFVDWFCPLGAEMAFVLKPGALRSLARDR